MPFDFYISIIAASILFVFLALFILAFVFRYNQQQRAFEEEKREIELAFQAEAARSQMELSEQLLTRISQEVHDNIGASLTLTKMHLGAMDSTNYETKTNRALELLTRAIQDLRQLSKSINGSFMLEMGLEEAINKELSFAHIQGSFETRLTRPEQEIIFDTQTEVILFRSIQECINNAIKHAAASELHVEIINMRPNYTILISDNGKGIQADVIAKGVGFKSLESRMNAINGSFKVDSTIGKGTRVVLNFTYDRKMA